MQSDAPTIFNLDADNWPRYKGFVSADWIEGSTFRKLRRLDMTIPIPEVPEPGHAIVFVVLTPHYRQFMGKCDNCIRQHKPTNLNCSMTMKRKRSFLDHKEGHFDFKTQLPVLGKWNLHGVETMGQSNITVETWKCIAR